jgi:hypothetical protein
MKNILKLLDINVIELSYLLLISEQTIYAWFNRKNTIPPPHSTYISALEIYQIQKKKEDLALLSNRWEIENQAMVKTQGEKVCKDLKANLQQYTYELEKLKQKENKLLNRWHLSENYPQYLAPELRNLENVQAWCGLIGRKSKFELDDIKLAIKKLEQKIAGLKAEVAFWEG